MSAKKTPAAKQKPRTDDTPAGLLVPEKLATLVHYLRHEKVILDSDLSELYGVPTKVLNQAVQRNLGRFPSDFMFQLTEDEAANLRSQIVTSKNAENSLRSQIVTLKHGGRRSLPYAFTEQGVAMLSSVLRSERAVEVNIAIMRTFVQLRRLMDSNALLAEVIFISAFQHLRISAFTSGTRLPHHPIRPTREKTTQTPRTMIACSVALRASMPSNRAKISSQSRTCLKANSDGHRHAATISSSSPNLPISNPQCPFSFSSPSASHSSNSRMF